MKLLIIGADAVEYTYIFGHLDRFHTFRKMKNDGIGTSYSAFVQKGYKDSYLSEMNWASIYTGLEPWKHEIAILDKNRVRREPEMMSFEGLLPFWKVLNDKGYSVAVWNALGCKNPIALENGYAISYDCHLIETKEEKRVSPRTLQINEDKKMLFEWLQDNPPPRVYPKMLSQQGYDFMDLKKDSKLAWEAVEKYHFQESISNFEEELEYYFAAMKEAQKINPVDVMFFYTPTTDLIAHCCMYSDDNEVLISTYEVLDKKLGELLDTLNPDNVIFMSDHGMMNFKDIVNCSNEEIRHEAFGARDEVLWLKNRYIAFEAHNGALLFTAHALKGTFIAAGKDIKHTTLNEMRTLDIYPTILELCGCKVPEGREGFVLDIFNRPCMNDRILREEELDYKKIAVIQSHDPNVTDIIVNEIYLQNRFCKITLVGDSRYEEIYRNNPRISDFKAFEDYDINDYEEVYSGYCNTITGKMSHLRVK